MQRKINRNKLKLHQRSQKALWSKRQENGRSAREQTAGVAVCGEDTGTTETVTRYSQKGSSWAAERIQHKREGQKEGEGRQGTREPLQSMQKVGHGNRIKRQKSGRS